MLRLLRFSKSNSRRPADHRANDYADVVQACLANARCPGVTVWGFGDSFSWIPGTFPGEGAADLYDFDLKPKPAFESVKNVF